MDIHAEVSTLKNVGPQAAKKLNTIGIQTIQELLLYFPARYLDFTKFTQIKDLTPNEVVTVRGVIKSIQARFSFRSRTQLAEAIISDNTGSVKVVWFNQGYIAKQLQAGDEVLLSGKADTYKGLQLVNPVHEKVTEEMIHTGRLVPVYRLPEGLYNRTMRGFIKEALGAVEQIADIIPQTTQQEFTIIDLSKTIRELHFPSNSVSLKQAQTRMIFEEVFIQQLAVEQHKLLQKKLAAPSVKPHINLIKSFLETLPFTLTDGQKKALWQILQDLEHKHPMNRLLQGDVGSGKTLVALAAALNVTNAGYQVALLAPTEILAKQHYEGFRNYLVSRSSTLPARHSLSSDVVLTKLDRDGGARGETERGRTIGLLTRTFHQVDDINTSKQGFLKQLADGTINILIGTHAVLQDNTYFKNLALVVVDEQHRFGVEQRAKLLSVGTQGWSPHLLSMSATPIPRTLALSIYSDLEVSTLTELPKGRQKVISKIVPETNRQKAYDFIKKELAAGRQAFIITPLVEESEKLQVKSVKTEFNRLQKEVFQNYHLGLLYGTMKGTDKDKVMSAFNKHELDILVATSVIEIGIDVPNATVMVIEGADRFGLAQLHQLRGRVGRGQHQSYCMLFTESTNQKTMARLQFFASCHDGFKLAELDLEQRGFGSLFGKEQTGFNFKFSQYLTLKVLELSKSAASKLIVLDSRLANHPLLQKKVTPLVQNIHLE